MRHSSLQNCLSTPSVSLLKKWPHFPGSNTTLLSVTEVSLLWLFRLRRLIKILCHEAPEFSAV